MLNRLKNALACLGALLVFVTLVPPTWYAQWLAGSWNDEKAPVVIILGGDTVSGGVMGTTSYWRCVSAVIDVWRQGGVERMILSGDPETTNSMRAWMVGQGVPIAVLTIEGRSRTTRENALFTAALLRDVPGPYLLLTSDIHMWRAQRVFRKAGLAVIPRAAPDAFKRGNDWRDRWRVFLDIANECVKIAYYKSKSWI